MRSLKKTNGRNSKGGFTLIEVLVVVAIIGILASIVLIGLGGTRSKARDAKRIAEVRQAQNALELYYNRCGFYPGGVDCASSAPADWATLATVLTTSDLGITNFPAADPSGNPYLYGSTDGTSYVVGATLEAQNVALNDDLDGTIQGVDCGNAGVDDKIYCVQL
jgi:prepilin-type N-terminal cleavage/methylation domain-containing protein